MRRDLSFQAIGTGVLAAFVGYGSSVAIVIQGLRGVGADEGQIASALAVLCATMGLIGIVLSAATRMPISVAWSTPGMALLASGAALPGGFAAGTFAFMVVGLLIMLVGLWSPLGRLISAIPKPVASGMLAGILLKLCLAPFAALSHVPALALLVIVVWIVVGRFFRLWAAPAALVVALVAIGTTMGGVPVGALPHLAVVSPVVSWQAVVSIGLPLFIVTMASQNIPGLAVLAAHGYQPKTRPIFLLTGAASAAAALLGAPTINLAAITAALCAGPDAHADPARRWVAGAMSGVVYMALPAIAGIATLMVTRSSPILIEAVAGLALIGVFGTAILAAVAEERDRIPALMTFLVTASGFTLAGIGAAFWGLVAGLIVHFVYFARRGEETPQPALASASADAEGTATPSSSGAST